MERATRLVVLVSLISALALQVVLVARALPVIQIAALVAFVAALALSLLWRRMGPALVLSITYIAPALTMVSVGNINEGYLCVWLAALAGPIVATAANGSWHFPLSWKWPLVLWLLSIALVWPLILWRECDFNFGLLSVYHLANSGRGTPPPIEAVGITHDALTLGLPLLYLDWLLGVYAAGELGRFVRWVIAPMAIGWLLSDLVAVYQSFVNVRFLNDTVFGVSGRASGAMVDANPFGVISAMWGPALLATAVWISRRSSVGVAAGVESPSGRGEPLVSQQRARSLAILVAGVTSLLLSWIGVWASGSRTATMTAAVGLLFVLWYAFRAIYSRRARRLVLTGVTCAALVAAAVLAFASASAIGPFGRIRRTLPGLSGHGMAVFATEMWNRNGYGAAATRMIVEHPIVGVGFGSFETLVADYSGLFVKGGLNPDNAQNWYRQELAETGILGSVGWIVWLILLLPCIRQDTAGPRGFMAGAIKGTLVGVALVSLVGMPTANTAAALTVLIFLVWYLIARGDRSLNVVAAEEHASLSAVRWGAIGVLLTAFLAITAYVGWSAERPPYRALRFNWEYVSGFYDMEHPAGREPFRWTSQQAVDVFPVKGNYLKLTFAVHHPDADQHPVEAKVWVKSRLIADLHLHDGTPVTEYVQTPHGRKRMMIESWVSRTWRPSDHGSGDTRKLGLAVDDWTFVDKPPVGATVIN